MKNLQIRIDINAASKLTQNKLLAFSFSKKHRSEIFKIV